MFINMQSKKHLIKGLFTLLLMLFTTSLAIAQGPGGVIDPNPDVPLEGGDILLLAMGAGYVIIKLWQYQHKKKSQQQDIQ